MGTKAEDLANPDGCWARAADDELLFISVCRTSRPRRKAPSLNARPCQQLTRHQRP